MFRDDEPTDENENKRKNRPAGSFRKKVRNRPSCAPSPLLFALPLGGCGKEAADPLAYQSYPLTVEGSITGDRGEAEVTLEMTAPMTGTLSFHTPDSLRGYLFSLSEDGVTLSYGEITVPYKADGIPGGTHLLPRLFSLSAEKLVSARGNRDELSPPSPCDL